MKNPKLKLKKLDKLEEQGIRICGAVKCQKTSEIIIGTKKDVLADYGLCWKHWESYCEE